MVQFCKVCKTSILEAFCLPVPIFCSLCGQNVSFNGSLMVHEAPSSLAVWQAPPRLLLLVPSAKMRLQMTSRSHGGWLWAVWCYCCCSSTTLPLVTVTAHLNEHHGAPPGGFNAAWAQDTCLPFWCTNYILYVYRLYIDLYSN